MDSSYQTLLNKYNRLISRIKSLEEELNNKTEMLAERTEKDKLLEKHMRELCETICSKDRKEMKLGKEYSWSNIPIDELIDKSEKIFKKYIQDTKDLLERMQAEVEKRAQTIDSLEDQISVMLTSNPGAVRSKEELEKLAEEEKSKEETTSSLDYNTKKAVQNNEVTVIEDDDEFIEEEEAVFKDTIKKGMLIKAAESGIPIKQSETREQKKEKLKDEVIPHVVDLKKYEDKLDDISWLILDIIGSLGYSRYNMIEEEVLKREPSYSNSKVRNTIFAITKLDAIARERVSTPMHPNLYVYKLSDIGVRLYKDKFGKNPVKSEMEQIIAQHDNLEHGYGILDVAEIFKEQNRYKEVHYMDNRSHAIKTASGGKYVPDIVAIDQNGHKEYFEYELGTHTPKDFNAKCNKMSAITKHINIICPNTDTIEKYILPKVEKWINTRGMGALIGIVVRITPASTIKGVDLVHNKSWKYVYHADKSDKPERND